MKKDEQKIIPEDNPHAPLYLEGAADKGIVVFIHGFMGSPRHFDKLAAAAHNQGLTVVALLLPAHGGTAKEFGSGSHELWQNYIDSEVERFAREYTNIWLVGHSMGCLLAINAAVKHSNKICGLFLIALPLKIGLFSATAIKIRLKQVFSRERKQIKATYSSVCSVKSSPGMIVYMIKQVFELIKLKKAATANLHNLRAPVVAVLSENDELTSIKSKKILKSGLTGAPLENLLLTDSLHSYYQEKEWEKIEKLFLKFITAK